MIVTCSEGRGFAGGQTVWRSLSYRLEVTDAGRSASRRPRQRSDCTVIALAVMAGLAYDEAYDLLAENGRQCGRGFDFRKWAKGRPELTWIPFTAVKGEYRVCLGTVAERLPVGRFVLRLGHHVCALVDGVVYNDGQQNPVRGVEGDRTMSVPMLRLKNGTEEVAPLVVVDAGPGPERLPGEERLPRVGEWYQVRNDGSAWLGCVVHVGSNYAKIRGVGKGRHSDWFSNLTWRVHLGEFDQHCTIEPDAERIIAEGVARHQGKARLLMGKVRELTARLAVPMTEALPERGEHETEAIALRGSGRSMAEYKTALVKAKDVTLPELFKKIKRETEIASTWMEAQLIPLQAEAKKLKPAIDAIKGRIFSVQLYAGLVEELAEIAGGEPAPLATPLTLFQRRCYMDEECLARYETGGMEFRDIAAFDAWLARAANRDRLLPAPRCVVAFQVRRRDKEREAVNLRDYVQIFEMRERDKWTFLYLRNGERLYRLSTEIEFGAELFPDLDRFDLADISHARMFCSKVEDLVTRGEYEELLRENEERKRKLKTVPKDERWRYSDGYSRLSDCQEYSPQNVYYDDIRKHIAEQLQRHNRLVLILQGLLDRSPAFHPHPPWQLWTEEGSREGLRLIFDDSRALTPGDKPDFEAYRARLNASLKVGSVTVGQQDLWELREGEKESRRLDRDYRTKTDYRPKRSQPYGDPGPGMLARVANVFPGVGKCSYHWLRRRIGTGRYRYDDEPVSCSMKVSISDILNVDAYTPGDFRMFFDDPRTRADYLRWAPLLLEAEEYFAGNRKVGSEP